MISISVFLIELSLENPNTLFAKPHERPFLDKVFDQGKAKVSIPPNLPKQGAIIRIRIPEDPELVCFYHRSSLVLTQRLACLQA